MNSAIRPLTLILLLAAPAHAAGGQGAGVSWETRSFLSGFLRPAGQGSTRHLPFHQLVQLSARDLGVPGLSVHTQLWGMVDMLDLQEEERFAGDVNTLYLSFSPQEGGPGALLHGLELTVGRQFVAMGATLLEQVDGARARYLHGSGLELGLFGGAISGIRLLDQAWPDTDDDHDGAPDSVVGARVGYVDLGFLSGGVSLSHRWFDGETAHMDLGADLSFTPHDKVSISGLATLALGEVRLKEARATAAVYPVRPVSIIAGFHFTSPDLWIPRTSIFSVFSNETHMEASLAARWQAMRRLSLDASYGRRFYDADGADEAVEGGNRATLAGTWGFSVGGAQRGSAVLEVTRLESRDNAANRARLATRVPVPLLGRAFLLVADLELTLLDELVRDSRLALRGAGYLVAPVTSSLSVMAGGRGGFSPLFTREGAFLVRLTWTGHWAPGGGGSSKGGAL